MSRRLLPLLVAAVAVVAVAVAALVSASGDRTETGIVVGVQSTGLTDVSGFELRTTDGRAVDFRLGKLENATQFPPAHLLEHRVTAVPIIVHYRLEDGQPMAVRIEDAPAPSG